MDSQQNTTTAQEDVQKDIQGKPEIKSKSISIPAAIITAGILIALGLVLSGRNTHTTDTSAPAQQNAPAVVEPIVFKANQHVRGDLSKADVVIVEYSDSDCPYCERFHNTMKEVVQKYGTRVAWVYRYFPLDMHPNALNEALALECAGQLGGNTGFWSFLDSIIGITVTPEKSAAFLTSTAVSQGVDKALFEGCMANPATAKIITDQATQAQSYGAQGTPYSIAVKKDGTQVAIPGAYPTEEMIKIIDGLLK